MKYQSQYIIRVIITIIDIITISFDIKTLDSYKLTLKFELCLFSFQASNIQPAKSNYHSQLKWLYVDIAKQTAMFSRQNEFIEQALKNKLF